MAQVVRLLYGNKHRPLSVIWLESYKLPERLASLLLKVAYIISNNYTIAAIRRSSNIYLYIGT